MTRLSGLRLTSVLLGAFFAVAVVAFLASASQTPVVYTTATTQVAGTVTDPTGRTWVADKVAGFCRVTEPTAGTAGLIEPSTCLGGGGPKQGPRQPGAPAFVDPTTGSPGSGDEMVLIPDSAPGSADVVRAEWRTSSRLFEYLGVLSVFDGDLRPRAVSYGADRDAYVVFQNARAIVRILDPTADQPDLETVAFAAGTNVQAVAATEILSGNRITIYVAETSALRKFTPPTEGDLSSQGLSSSFGVGAVSSLVYDAQSNTLYAGTASAAAAGQDVVKRVNTTTGAIDSAWATGLTRVTGLGLRGGELMVADLH